MNTERSKEKEKAVPEKYDLAKMLEEIKEDSKIRKSIHKKWASQEDIKRMIKEMKKKKSGK